MRLDDHVPPSAPRHSARAAVAVLACLVLTAGVPTTESAPTARAEPVCPVPPPRSPPDVDVAAAVRAVDPSIMVGAVVHDLRRQADLLAIEADRQFRSASVVKLLIAIDALAGPTGDRDRIHTMLARSDDDIASGLWVAGGAGEIVTRTAGLLELRHTEPPRRPGLWGNTLMSARDIAATYRHILTELPGEDRDLIMDALVGTTREAADGWHQHFGIPEGIGTPWAVKQGWSNSAENLVVHTTGLAGEDLRYVVVLLLEDTLPADWASLRRAATAGAAAAEPLLTHGSR